MYIFKNNSTAGAANYQFMTSLKKFILTKTIVVSWSFGDPNKKKSQRMFEEKLSDFHSSNFSRFFIHYILTYRY